MIKDSNLRPFAIMGEIEESLNNKTINGLGKITGGDSSGGIAGGIVYTTIKNCYNSHLMGLIRLLFQ